MWLSGLLLFAGLVLLLLALGVYSPQEVTRKLEQAATKKLIESK